MTDELDEPLHAVGFYDSIGELLELSGAFCEDTLRAGAHVVVALPPGPADALRAALDTAASAVTFLAHDEQYQHPPAALTTLRNLLEARDPGASRGVCFLGQPPLAGGLARDGWLRYEAAVNRCLADAGLRVLCVYPQGDTDEVVRRELRRTHPAVATAANRWLINPGYEVPESFLSHRLEVVSDPLERDRPTVELTDPDVIEARHAVAALADDMGLDQPAADDLVTGVSEVLTNAVMHGRPPVTARGWGVPGRVAVAVCDAGEGPRDPVTGLLPAEQPSESGGLGLWITQQLCPETAIAVTDDGCTVRLAVGESR